MRSTAKRMNETWSENFNDVNEYTYCIIAAIISAADATIPFTCGRTNNKRVSRLTERIHSLRPTTFTGTLNQPLFHRFQLHLHIIFKSFQFFCFSSHFFLGYLLLLLLLLLLLNHCLGIMFGWTVINAVPNGVVANDIRQTCIAYHYAGRRPRGMKTTL
jgi:hypothetical protein